MKDERVEEIREEIYHAIPSNCREYKNCRWHQDIRHLLQKLDEANKQVERLEAIADAAVEVQDEVGINTYPHLRNALIAAEKIKNEP